MATQPGHRLSGGIWHRGSPYWAPLGPADLLKVIIGGSPHAGTVFAIRLTVGTVTVTGGTTLSASSGHQWKVYYGPAFTLADTLTDPIADPLIGQNINTYSRASWASHLWTFRAVTSSYDDVGDSFSADGELEIQIDGVSVATHTGLTIPVYSSTPRLTFSFGTSGGDVDNAWCAADDTFPALDADGLFTGGNPDRLLFADPFDSGQGPWTASSSTGIGSGQPFVRNDVGAVTWGVSMFDGGPAADRSAITKNNIAGLALSSVPLSSNRTALFGSTHIVLGDDILIAGQRNQVTGEASEAHGADATVNGALSVLYSLDGGANALNEDGKFKIAGDFEVTGTATFAGAGVGNVTGQSASIDSEIALFSGTTGKVIKRATGTGFVKVASGVYQTPAGLALSDLPPLPYTQFWPAAVCDQGGAYAPLWNSNGDTTAPGYQLESGTNLTAASLEFVDTGTNQVFQTFALPDDWSGALDLKIFWKCTPTTGNVVWQVQTAAVTIGGTFDPTWNTAQTVTDAAQGTTQRVNVASIANLTTTGLAAGGWLAFRIVRDPSHASDTLGASAFFLGAELKYRRTLV